MSHPTGLSWGFYALQWAHFVFVLVILWMLVDAFRPIRKARLARIIEVTGQGREPLWVYQAIGVMYVAFAIVGFIPQAPSFVRMVGIFTDPIAVIGLLAYLLRVVFPKSPAGVCIELTKEGEPACCSADDGPSFEE